jgi:hypothetical protein
MPKLPEGWSQMELRDLLPESAIKEITKLYNKHQLTIAELKRICAKHKEALLAKEVDDRFLAYALAHSLGIYT